MEEFSAHCWKVLTKPTIEGGGIIGGMNVNGLGSLRWILRTESESHNTSRLTSFLLNFLIVFNLPSTSIVAVLEAERVL